MTQSRRGTSLVALLAASSDAGELLAQQANAGVNSGHDQADPLEAIAHADRTDELTGLGNRSAGDDQLACLAPGDALVVLELDRFETVNDTFGSSCGDEVLKSLGAFLLREMKAADTVARMGGEQFLLVLRGNDAVNGELVIERLIRTWHDTDPLATLSAGVAFHSRGQTRATTHAFADSALRAAKTAGRDRMVLATSYWRP